MGKPKVSANEKALESDIDRVLGQIMIIINRPQGAVTPAVEAQELRELRDAVAAIGLRMGLVRKHTLGGASKGVEFSVARAPTANGMPHVCRCSSKCVNRNMASIGDVGFKSWCEINPDDAALSEHRLENHTNLQTMVNNGITCTTAAGFQEPIRGTTGAYFRGCNVELDEYTELGNHRQPTRGWTGGRGDISTNWGKVAKVGALGAAAAAATAATVPGATVAGALGAAKTAYDYIPWLGGTAEPGSV